MDLGVFGGTFDPPHLGHLLVAQDVREALSLDRVIFVPARRSPFKDDAGTEPAEHRLRMVEAAVEGDPSFSVSRLELDRPEPSWTVDTVRELRTLHPGARITLLMGVDQWRHFREWKDPLEIARLARIAVFARNGETPEDYPDRAVVPTVVKVRRLDLSSTELRARLGRGESIRYLVPDAVRSLIEHENWYGSGGADSTPGGPDEATD